VVSHLGSQKDAGGRAQTAPRVQRHSVVLDDLLAPSERNFFFEKKVFFIQRYIHMHALFYSHILPKGGHPQFKSAPPQLRNIADNQICCGLKKVAELRLWTLKI
jgi:hypothetical protein